MPNIAIVWDFDGTLTAEDSTGLVIEDLAGKQPDEFWAYIKNLRGEDDKRDWEHILASDAPIWMYALSRIAFAKRTPLNEIYFQLVRRKIKLYPQVKQLLKNIKSLADEKSFKRTKTSIYHFIVSAGLHDLIRLVFDRSIVEHVWGCRYEVIKSDENDAFPESVPVYCMDETVKTRALFEISKGTFSKPKAHHVNAYVPDSELFCPFENMIYIGDGFSDVPALSLVRSKGGTGIIVYDPGLTRTKRKTKIDPLRRDKRADLVTEAIFSKSSELYKALRAKCIQIQQKHAAHTVY